MVNPRNPAMGTQPQMQQPQQPQQQGQLQMSPSQQMMLARQLMGQQGQEQQARSPLESIGNTLMNYQRQQQLQQLYNQGGGQNGAGGGMWGNGLLNCSRSFKTNNRPVADILPGV